MTKQRIKKQRDSQQSETNSHQFRNMILMLIACVVLFWSMDFPMVSLRIAAGIIGLICAVLFARPLFQAGHPIFIRHYQYGSRERTTLIPLDITADAPDEVADTAAVLRDYGFVPFYRTEMRLPWGKMYRTWVMRDDSYTILAALIDNTSITLNTWFEDQSLLLTTFPGGIEARGPQTTLNYVGHRSPPEALAQHEEDIDAMRPEHGKLYVVQTERNPDLWQTMATVHVPFIHKKHLEVTRPILLLLVVGLLLSLAMILLSIISGSMLAIGLQVVLFASILGTTALNQRQVARLQTVSTEK